MKIPFIFKGISLLLALALPLTPLPERQGPVFSRSVGVSSTTLAPFAGAGVQIARTAAEPAVGAVQEKNPREKGLQTLRKILPVAESAYLVTGAVLGALAAPQYFLLMIAPRVIWNLAVLLHSFAHTLLGALGVGADTFRKGTFWQALRAGLDYINTANLTESLGWKMVFCSFLPLPFLVPFLGFGIRKASDPEPGIDPAAVSGPWLKTQAVGGVLANLALVAVGGGGMFAALALNAPFWPLLLLTALPAIGFNLLSILFSEEDWAVFFTGVPRRLKSGLLGAQMLKPRKEDNKSRMDFQRVLESQVKLSPHGWGGQSLGVLHDSSGIFLVQALRNLHNGELVKALRRSFAYTRLSLAFLRLFSRKQQRSETNYLSYVMHVDSRKTEVSEPVEAQPVAGKKNTTYVRWWCFDGRKLEPREILWTNYVTLSGRFDGIEWQGKFRSEKQLQWYLQHVLSLYENGGGEASTIAMMMDLLITKGSWSKSARLAYQQMRGARFEDAFADGTVGPVSGLRGKLTRLRRLAARLFPGLKRQMPDLATEFLPLGGAPNAFVIRRWGDKFDAVFERFVRAHQDRMFSQGGKPDLAQIKEEYRLKLAETLVREIGTDRQMFAFFGYSDVRVKEFVLKTIQAFCHNNTFEATRMFAKTAQGAMGLFTGSTSDQGHVLAALGQPLSLGLAGSDLQHISRRGWASDEELLNLKDEKGELVYRWTMPLDDEVGEIVDLGENLEDITIHNLRENRTLSVSEVDDRMLDLSAQDNDLLSPPLKLLNGQDPVETAIQSYPETFDRIQESWGTPPVAGSGAPPPSRNLQSAEELYRKFRAKAERIQRQRRQTGDTNVNSRTYDIVLLGSGHNFDIAEQCEKSFSDLFPDLGIKCIDAADLLKNPRKYSGMMDADTLVVSLSHTTRRDPTYLVSREMQRLFEQVPDCEGGLFVVSSRWNTQTTRLAGVDPVGRNFRPRVFSSFSGKIYADPSMHAPPFLLTMLEMQHYVARRLLADGAADPGALGKKPLGMDMTGSELDEVHRLGSETLRHTGQVVGGGPKKGLNRGLAGIGKKLSSYSFEDVRVLLVASFFLVLSISLHFPMPFAWLFNNILLVSYPGLATAVVFMGTQVVPILFSLLDIFFWELFIYYVIWFVRAAVGHPVFISKSGIQRLYLGVNGDYGGKVAVTFAKKALGSVWPTNKIAVDAVSEEQQPAKASLVVYSVPMRVGGGPRPAAEPALSVGGRIWNFIKKRIPRFSMRAPETFAFGAVGGAQSAGLQGASEFEFYRYVQHEADRLSPAWSAQGRRLFSRYDALLRNVGHFVIIGSMVSSAKSLIRIFRNPLALFRLKTRKGAEDGTEPTGVAVMQLMLSGMIGFSIIKGVLKQTLFATGGLSVNLIFIGLIAAVIFALIGISRLLTEGRYFKAFFIDAVRPGKRRCGGAPEKNGELDVQNLRRELSRNFATSRAARRVSGMPLPVPREDFPVFLPEENVAQDQDADAVSRMPDAATFPAADSGAAPLAVQPLISVPPVLNAEDSPLRKRLIAGKGAVVADEIQKTPEAFSGEDLRLIEAYCLDSVSGQEETQTRLLAEAYVAGCRSPETEENFRIRAVGTLLGKLRLARKADFRARPEAEMLRWVLALLDSLQFSALAMELLRDLARQPEFSAEIEEALRQRLRRQDPAQTDRDIRLWDLAGDFQVGKDWCTDMQSLWESGDAPIRAAQAKTFVRWMWQDPELVRSIGLAPWGVGQMLSRAQPDAVQAVLFEASGALLDEYPALLDALLGEIARAARPESFRAAVDVVGKYLESPRALYAPKVNDLLTQSLDARNPLVRARVIEILSRRPQMPCYTFLLSPEGFYAGPLAEKAEPVFADVFRAALDFDPDPEVRKSAIRALRRALPREEALAFFVSLAENHAEAFIRAEAAAAVCRIIAKAGKDFDVMSVLVRLEPAMARLLDELGAETSIRPMLEKYLELLALRSDLPVAERIRQHLDAGQENLGLQWARVLLARGEEEEAFSVIERSFLSVLCDGRGEAQAKRAAGAGLQALLAEGLPVEVEKRLVGELVRMVQLPSAASGAGTADVVSVLQTGTLSLRYPEVSVVCVEYGVVSGKVAEKTLADPRGVDNAAYLLQTVGPEIMEFSLRSQALSDLARDQKLDSTQALRLTGPWVENRLDYALDAWGREYRELETAA